MWYTDGTWNLTDVLGGATEFWYINPIAEQLPGTYDPVVGVTGNPEVTLFV